MKDRPHKIRIPKTCPECGEALGRCRAHGTPVHLRNQSHLCSALLLRKAVLASIGEGEFTPRPRATWDPAFP